MLLTPQTPYWISPFLFPLVFCSRPKSHTSRHFTKVLVPRPTSKSASHPHGPGLTRYQVVVSTHWKNMSENGFILPNSRGENSKNIWNNHLGRHWYMAEIGIIEIFFGPILSILCSIFLKKVDPTSGRKKCSLSNYWHEKRHSCWTCFFSFLEMWYLVVEIKGFLLWDHWVDESCNDSLKF